MAALPDTMHALVLKHDGYSGTSDGPTITDLKDWVSLEEISVPKPGARQVLIKIGLANVNPSDLHYIKGEYGQPRRQGAAAGFEGMGEVVAAGEDEASRTLIGQRVAVAAGRTGTGVWAEYALADAAAVVPLAPGLRDEDAAALIVNPMTAWAMVDLVRDYGSSAFVMTAGASQLCKLMASLARDRDMHAIAVVRREEHRAMLEGLGAGTVLNSAREDFDELLVQAMKETKPRVLLDAVADQDAATIFTAMPAGARWVIYGKLSPEAPKLPGLGQMVFMKKVIEGFWLAEWMARATPEQRVEGFTEVQKRFLSGAWQTDVAETIPLAEAPDRLAAALDGMNRGKVFLRP
ncbi:alcohol dehydrogenase catalytic domain-containing protein [Aurantimonas aggregata]|uniref:Alcohol dehydrogenase catalytic domain-containing protein n=1 Tax=Aurantimonas aggregata TaxID=2047720 RepID=A0A6L9MJE6_9HYPH|nr:alcohol dehydrogenase catalytic domain-containing protein [Aurantimonas aggregata]NDV87851.1 alcohol dehydrogenase catalytic domain-containing protein [Aurantimonas aggregata]